LLPVSVLVQSYLGRTGISSANVVSVMAATGFAEGVTKISFQIPSTMQGGTSGLFVVELGGSQSENFLVWIGK
jgi:hypothetical protein